MLNKIYKYVRIKVYKNSVIFSFEFLFHLIYFLFSCNYFHYFHDTKTCDNEEYNVFF